MNTKRFFILLPIYFLFLPVQSILALELVRPAQDTKVHPGDTITIEVKPSPGERIGRVYFDGLSANKVDIPPYEYKYTVGPHDIGNIKIDIFSMKPESDGPFTSLDAQFSSSIELHLKSTLPPTVTLQGIRVRKDQKYLFMETDDKRKIRVYGQYSDGVERDVSSSATATIYISSDDKIATVDSNGRVTAIGLGTAKITIKNGKNEIIVEVNVKPKK